MPPILTQAFAQAPPGKLHNGGPFFIDAGLNQHQSGWKRASFPKINRPDCHTASVLWAASVALASGTVKAESDGGITDPSTFGGSTSSAGVTERRTARPRCFLTSVFLKRLTDSSRENGCLLERHSSEAKALKARGEKETTPRLYTYSGFITCDYHFGFP